MYINLYYMILNMFELIVAFVLGIVEGITEFFPISSTGHIILITYCLDYINDSSQMLIIIMQFGTILSTVIIFRNQLCNINVNCISNLFVKKHYRYDHLCIYHMFIGTVPGGFVGLIFYKKIKLLFLDPIYVIYGLILGSIFLLIAEWNVSKLSINRTSDINKISCLQSFLIGCCQCLSFFPGFSRAGSTIAGGLLVGLNRRIALEFSFLLSMPIILGSIILTLYYYKSCIYMFNIMELIIGSITAFVTSFFTIRFFLRIVQNISLVPFVMYRFLLAAIIYWGAGLYNH